MKKIALFLIVIAISTLILSGILYSVLYKSNPRSERIHPSADAQQPSAPKSFTKLDNKTGKTERFTALVPSISTESPTESDNKPNPPEVYWSELTKQLLELELEREKTTKLLTEKAKPQP
ncbi:MAG: hypothetical protein BWK79_12645 [Beggiatoa sp. IS2]|nr:MAG: hypothetical protein BWK79_12645 [Beggiatoa sp. IS2]